MNQEKQPHSAEKSLSYIAWSMKEISQNIDKLVKMTANHIENSSNNTKTHQNSDKRQSGSLF